MTIPLLYKYSHTRFHVSEPLTCPWVWTLLQWWNAHCLDSRGELIQFSYHPMWKLLPTLCLTHPDSAYLTFVLNFGVVYESSATQPTWSLQGSNCWLRGGGSLHLYPHMSFPKHCCITRKCLPRPLGKKQLGHTFCQLLKSQTCSGCSSLTGTDRSQHKLEPMLISHWTQTNKVGLGHNKAFLRCVCGLFLDRLLCWEYFESGALSINAVGTGDKRLSPDQQPSLHSTAHGSLMLLKYSPVFHQSQWPFFYMHWLVCCSAILCNKTDLWKLWNIETNLLQGFMWDSSFP